jgi:excisionase family DNA binding protein
MTTASLIEPVEQAKYKGSRCNSDGVPGSEFVTVLGASKILGLSKSCVYNYLDNGLLPHVRYPGYRGESGAIRIRRSDIEAFISANQVGTQIAVAS